MSLNWVLVGDLLCRKSCATIRGMMAPLYNSVHMVGPVGAGFIFDWTGTYTPVLISGGVLMLLSAVVFLRLKAPIRPVREPEPPQVVVPDAIENASESRSGAND